ncbi:MAG TPA: NfeD family protein [Anaerolineaceae bacterium]|nr:NfeD family protein [Anaerolineaceae bacterium]
MNFLVDPNVAYVLLVGGLLLAILALFSPGSGVLEIGGLFLLILAGLGISNFTINFWALVVLVLGIFPFILALRRSRQYVFLIVALAALVVGTVFLIAGPGGTPGINPVLATVVSLIVTVFVWGVARRSLEALSLPKKTLADLIGKTGEATTDVFAEGSVYVDGEEWSGTSKVFIPAGSTVRVVAREGLVLTVEPV